MKKNDLLTTVLQSFCAVYWTFRVDFANTNDLAEFVAVMHKYICNDSLTHGKYKQFNWATVIYFT